MAQTARIIETLGGPRVVGRRVRSRDQLAERLRGAWLSRPNQALGGCTPLSVLDTDVGLQEVDEILGRIEYGIFS